MSECTSCIKQVIINELENKVRIHEKRISLLESFKDWASPIIQKIEEIERNINSVTTFQKIQTIVFIAFVSILSYIYTVQVWDFMKKQPEDKIEIIREIHNLEKRIDSRVEDINKQLIKTSIKNYKED